VFKFLLLIPLLLATAAPAAAQRSPGDLDPGFGVSGWVTLPAGVAPNSEFIRLFVDLDGSILLVGGEIGTGAQAGVVIGCFLTRLLPDGSLDLSFGSGGIVDVARPSGDPFDCGGALLLPDGSVLVLGSLFTDEEVIKLRPDGTLDASFGTGGLLELTTEGFPAGWSGPRNYSAILLASGEILISGFDSSYTVVWAVGQNQSSIATRFDSRRANGAFFIERPDGGFSGVDSFLGLYTYDNLFATEIFQSRLSSPAGQSGNVFSTDGVVRQPDGRIVASIGGPASGDEFGMTRWALDGQPDATFFSGLPARPGQSLINLSDLGFSPERSNVVSAVALHPDGFLFQTHDVWQDASPQQHRGVILALRADGSKETAWSNDGVSILHYPGSERTHLRSLALDPNNKILAAGYGQYSDGVRRPVVARLQALSAAGSSWDTMPDAVNLPPLLDVPRNAIVESSPLTISGLDAGSYVPAMVDGGEYRVNSGPWVAAPSWVGNGDTIRIRHRTPSDGNASTLTTLRVGGVLDPQNARRSTGQVQFFSFQSVTIDPLPGGKCSEASLCNHGQAIPDNSPSTPVTATLNQIESCPFIRSIRVGVDVSHTYVGDLQVILDPPNTPPFSLINRPNSGAGNCFADDILATFEAGEFPDAQTQCGQFGAGLRAIDGTVRPALGFPLVIGSNGQGAWTLEVRDFAGADIGTLNDWSLQLECANQPLNLADLEVTTTQPANLFAGESRIWTISVTNNGPARAEFARFFGEVGRSVVSGLPELNPSSWSCTAPAGSTCTLPPGCTGPFCGGADFSPGLNLAPGATATIELLAAPDAMTPLGNEVGFSARVENLLAIDGAVDPDTGNNSVEYRRDVLVAQDLGITDARAIVIGNEVEVSFRITNAGPSAELRSAQVDVQMPSGYLAATRAECSRGAAPCSGSLSVLVNQPPRWNYDDFVLVPGATPERLVFRAAFSGPSAPSGPIQVEISGAANEQDPTDNAVSLTPMVISDAIFSDRFQ
jgi:uncharacterized delta-60 repeat protein